MKVTVGDYVESINFEGGTIVAMTDQWCVYKSCKDNVEFALPWDEIFVPAEPSKTISSIESKELAQPITSPD